MPVERKVPATVPAHSNLPKALSDGLVARGLLAVRQSAALACNEDAESLFKKGMRFRNSEEGTRGDDEMARTYLLAAAKLNHAAAQFELCTLLGENAEWSEAISWLEKSVSLGFGPAQAYLAEFLSDPLIAEHLSNQSYSEPELYQKACVWYENQAAAGDAEAQYEFALWLNQPDSPIHDRERAFHWMTAAAKQAHGFACMRLGDWLLHVEESGRGAEEGIYWLSRAADLGKSHACHILGNLYLRGHTGGRYARGASQIVAPDKHLAVSWYERQIELEKQRGSFLGTHSLARLYLEGEHLTQDLALAERMLLSAALAGNLDSQRLLASQYVSGTRLKRDAVSALHWLMIAEQNSDSSKRTDQYQLGYFYEHHADDAPNYAKAAEWYRKAADVGDYKSQKKLGSFYEFGNGVPRDFEKAYMWYLLSAANSYGKAGIRDFHSDALRLRELLAPKMSRTQLAEARQLARKWMDEIATLRADDHELAREGLDRAS